MLCKNGLFFMVVVLGVSNTSVPPVVAAPSLLSDSNISKSAIERAMHTVQNEKARIFVGLTAFPLRNRAMIV